MSVALLRWAAVLRAWLRRFFRRPTVQQRGGSLFRRYHPDQVGPHTRDLTPEELREMRSTGRGARRETYLEQRARERGYYIPDDWRF
jgi:hypothetical protein